MPKQIDYRLAESKLTEALSLARADTELPVNWRSHVKAVFQMDAKTWTPVLGTLLLAKALNSSIDALSLKVDPANPGSYSARGLCHEVLVPAAREHGFSIRNTGREPMNNQPFFRYDRIDAIERSRNSEDRDYFVAIAREADLLSPGSALLAFAVFLREAIEQSPGIRVPALTVGEYTLNGTKVAVGDFLRADAQDRPLRLQAFAAACLDLQFDDVRSRRLNDPSRDAPGDVLAMSESHVLLTVEVRGKPVTSSDIGIFADACSNALIGRAIMFSDVPAQQAPETSSATDIRRNSSLELVAYSSAFQLLTSCLIWVSAPLPKALRLFAKRYLFRLEEIQASPTTLQEWLRTVAVAQHP